MASQTLLRRQAESVLTAQDSAKLLNEEQAAELLGVQANTLAVWRSTHRYDLPFVRVGRAIRYRLADLLAWIESRTITASDQAE